MIKTNLYSKCNTCNFEKLFKEKGYAYFTEGLYNLNIIGVRNNDTNLVTNKYDDYLIVIYNTPKCKGLRKIYPITTEPGLYYIAKHHASPKGAAILVPDQYRGCWQIGLHKGIYKALCQKKPVKVYRDNNYDNVYDMNPETIEKGMLGINIHRSNEFYIQNTIDKYSAGCQVFKNFDDFESFMRLCEKQKALYGNSFTYTLINESDLI